MVFDDDLNEFINAIFEPINKPKKRTINDTIKDYRNAFPICTAIEVAVMMRDEGWRMKGGVNALANYIVRNEL